MSLKMMPGLGKSGMSLMLSKIISFSSFVRVLILFDFLLSLLWRCFSLHFFRKNEAKNRCGSRIALLSRTFATTGTLRVINGLIAYASYPKYAPKAQPSILATRPACLPPSNSVEAKTSIISSMTPLPTTRSPKQRMFASLCCLVSLAV